MKKAGTIFLTIISILFIATVIFFGLSPAGKNILNKYEDQHKVKEPVEDYVQENNIPSDITYSLPMV